jgi:hypothetical protein
MPYKNKEDRLNYGRKYMKTKRSTVVVPIVIPIVIPEVIPEVISPHYHIKWTRRLYRVHREFYKSAWFARWAYEMRPVFKELISSLETIEE